MRAKILIALMLAAVCAASKEDWDAFISPLKESDPNGKTKFFLYGGQRDERLDAALADPDPRVVDDIRILSVAIEDLRRIFEVYGKQATKLNIGTADHVYKAQDLFDVLNLLPNLEELTFDVRDSSIEGEAAGTLSLKNLNTLYVDKQGSIFLSKVLPENILKFVTISEDKNYGELLKKQQSIKRLTIGLTNPIFTDAFNNLKLDTFVFYPESDDVDFLQTRRDFIKAVIATQPYLKFLSLEFSKKGEFNIINDEFLVEISKLSKLENFMFLMVGAGLTNLEPLGNLKGLKTLSPRAEEKTPIELFKKLSDVKFESLEKLDLFRCFRDLPADVFEKMSQNMPKLKVLEGPQSTFHTINFYAKTFPQIEDLTIKFVAENGEVATFDAFYDKNLKFVHQNMKNLRVTLGSRVQGAANADDFVEFLGTFPNLINLEIHAGLPFTTEFLTKLADNLNNIEKLKIGWFLIDDTENFDVETSNALKAIASKLKYVAVVLSHEGQKFSFQPLIDQVKDVFTFTEIYGGRKLKLEAGDGCKNSDERDCLVPYY